MQKAKPERLLLVARHAQAEPASLGAQDHERLLTDVGREQCEQGRVWLEKADFDVDRRWSSDANRAQETARLLSVQAGGDEPELHLSNDLYFASAHSFLNDVSEAPEEAHCLLVVAHQPVVSAVVAVLTGRHLNYPPATIVAVGLKAGWKDIGADGGWVHDVFRPTIGD